MRPPAEAITPRLRRWAGVAVTVSLVAGAAGWVAVARHQSTPVALADSVARFRAGVRPADPDPTGRSTTPVATVADPVRERAVGEAAPTATAGGGPGGPSSAASRRERPAAGVYTYRTEGRDEISVLGAHHEYPEETHATVTHEAGCRWHVDHPLVEEHVEREERCTDASAFRLLADGSEIEYFGQRDQGGFRCDPPLVLAAEGDQPGSRRTMTCPGEGDDEADFTVTVHGTAAVAVAGVSVPAVHVTVDVQLRGRATGSARAEVWFHHRSGLPLRVIRTVDTNARAIFGEVRYRERLRLELHSLDPAR